MRILIAGGGRVARALETALTRKGLDVARWSRAEQMATEDLTGAPDAALIAVADRAITEVAERLLADGLIAHSTVLLHTAGAIAPRRAFSTVRGLVAGEGVLHPLRAMAGAPEDAELEGTVFGIAGDEAGRRAATAICDAIGGRALPLEDEALPRYHAAAVLASNHTLALVDAAIGLLVAEGLERRAAERAISGLLASAAKNVGEIGLPEALTGPIARGDEETVAGHLSALPSSVVELYRETGLATVSLARGRRGAPVEALDRIADRLRRRGDS